ncbi:MAG: transposase [Cellvibrionaceae bacterium]
MPKPRHTQIAVEDTRYYHCISRCVRRAFLCGTDNNGNSYEHRRQWIEDRIRILSSIFAIDICSYAVMSNHYHIVVKLDSTKDWSDEKVIQHWLILHKGPLLIQRFNKGEALSQAELNTIQDIVAIWRKRLQDLSWFMKCLNEPIARMANAEDNCTGHFWESRFKCHPLLTEEALLSCMAYVDLNPIRAFMADTPEESDHTSIKERIAPEFNLAEAIAEQNLCSDFLIPIKPLAAFEDNVVNQRQSGILFSLSDYLQLVDWTGKIIRDDKRGHISNKLPPILTRLNIPIEEWLTNSQQFEKIVHRRFRKAA